MNKTDDLMYSMMLTVDNTYVVYLKLAKIMKCIYSHEKGRKHKHVR